MKDSLTIIVAAAKETPRLYFAPIIAALRAVSKVEDAMVETQRASNRNTADVPKNKPSDKRG